MLGIALIAMGEEIGAEMALRTFGHLVSIAWRWEYTGLGAWRSLEETFLIGFLSGEIVSLLCPFCKIGLRPLLSISLFL